MDGREYVIPDDVQHLLPQVLAHRMLLTSDAHVAGRSADDVLHRIVRTTPIPNSSTAVPPADSRQAR